MTALPRIEPVDLCDHCCQTEQPHKSTNPASTPSSSCQPNQDSFDIMLKAAVLLVLLAAACPLGTARPLDSISHLGADRQSLLEDRAALVRQATKDAFWAYWHSAEGRDELKPIAKTGSGQMRFVCHDTDLCDLASTDTDLRATHAIP
jgi:hypothetical protein